MRDQIEALELSTQDPLACGAFVRLYQVVDDPAVPEDRSRLLNYATAEAEELQRQATYYQDMDEFYHPNVAHAREAEAAVMRALIKQL